MEWLLSYPPSTRISNFQKEHFIFYEKSENLLFDQKQRCLRS